jgi:hypothetical protein
MNRTTTLVVVLIAAASLSTIVYAIPEQRAMAHPRLHLFGPNFSPDAFPFGPNSPDPPLSPSKSDPPPSPPGITAQNLANGAVTTPKIAPGVVSTEVFGPATDFPPNTGGQLVAKCHSGTVVSGGGFSGGTSVDTLHGAIVEASAPFGLGSSSGTGWFISIYNPTSQTVTSLYAVALCASIQP